MPVDDPLSQLRDIHLPGDPSWWPPAPGWWMLAVLVLLLSFLALRFLVKKYRLWRRRQQVLKLFNILSRQVVAGKNNHAVLAELSKLMRRVALLATGRQAAGLCGEAWLNFLDRTGDTLEFSRGAGRLLIYAPYQAHHGEDLQSLLALIRHWLQKNV